MARLKSANTVSATATLKLDTTAALGYVNEALFEATQEVVGFDTVATAKELCPVLPKPTKEREPGELRGSIDASVKRNAKGVRASITTKTGYGGFVELGTTKTPAEPYLWPAFEQNIGKLVPAIQENIANLTGKGN
jgi:HK97 gp10 family phage protein